MPFLMRLNWKPFGKLSCLVTDSSSNPLDRIKISSRPKIIKLVRLLSLQAQLLHFQSHAGSIYKHPLPLAMLLLTPLNGPRFLEEQNMAACKNSFLSSNNRQSPAFLHFFYHNYTKSFLFPCCPYFCPNKLLVITFIPSLLLTWE